MKSDIDIKDEMYRIVRASPLPGAVTGRLSKTLRPAGSRKEDIVISVLANNPGQMQSAFINVNIYVADIRRDEQSEEDTVRLRELCSLCMSCLERGFGKDFRYELDTQRVIALPDTGEHLINNKFFYQTNNE